MQVEILEGLRKHRKVTLRAEETHDLQAVAWRLQEMGGRMGHDRRNFEGMEIGHDMSTDGWGCFGGNDEDINFHCWTMLHASKEMQLRMCQGALLTERDFDLQVGVEGVGNRAEQCAGKEDLRPDSRL